MTIEADRVELDDWRRAYAVVEQMLGVYADHTAIPLTHHDVDDLLDPILTASIDPEATRHRLNRMVLMLASIASEGYAAAAPPQTQQDALAREARAILAQHRTAAGR